jgi:ABC-type uncharacterized transport system permease subunit
MGVLKSVRIIKWIHVAFLVLIYFFHHMPTFYLVLKGIKADAKSEAVRNYYKSKTNLEITLNFVSVQSESEM